jgi:hypothetical protein
LHDSQAAIPLAHMTAQRVINLYDVADSAYDAQPIHEYIRSLGHIPLIDVHPRRDAALKEELQAEAQAAELPLRRGSALQRKSSIPPAGWGFLQEVH